MVLDQIPFELDIHRLFTLLHLDPIGDYADEVQTLADRAMQVAKPKAMYEVAFIEERGEESVVINGILFESRILQENLSQVEQVFPYVATCGVELDELAIATNDLIGQYCLETIKMLALEASKHYLLEHLRKEYNLKGIMTIRLGYVGGWPIEQQKSLFALLGDVEHSIGVTLSESLLMLPNKTISNLAYAAEEIMVNHPSVNREP